MQVTRLDLCPPPEKSATAKTTQPETTRKKMKQTTSKGITRATDNRRKLSMMLEDGCVVIRIPFAEVGKASTSGKTNIYGSTRGPRRVMRETANGPEPVIIDNGYLKAIASVFAAPNSIEKTDSTN